VHRVLHLDVDMRPWRGTLGFFAGRRRRALANARQLSDAVAAAQPDVLLVWGMWNLSRNLLSLAEAWGRPPVAYYIADYWPTLPDAYALHWHSPAGHWWMRAPKAALSRILDRLQPLQPPPPLAFAHAACVSAAVRARLIDEGVPLQQAAVIHCGIDLQPFRPAAAAPGSAELRIGYAGRLAAEKGVETLLDALALLRQRGLAARVTLAGSALEARSLMAIRDCIDRLDLHDRISLLGQVPSEKMPALLAQFDVLVVPSRWPEPLARVIQEGMASGAVVVATAVGGTVEIVDDGVNGLLFPPGDAPALAECLARLHGDPALRARLARAGRQTVESRFDLTATVDRIEQLLQRTVSDAP
jgi:glycosyltransferase involved in cell wall biosynthesis